MWWGFIAEALYDLGAEYDGIDAAVLVLRLLDSCEKEDKQINYATAQAEDFALIKKVIMWLLV